MFTRAALSAALLSAAVLVASPVAAGDDWSFISGRYAIGVEDCAVIAKGKPFSKVWVDALGQEALTREGITSPRETHCKFRTSEKVSDGNWTVHADCEEMGDAQPYDLTVVASGDGTIAVTSEDVFGPKPLAFKKCAE